MDLGQQARGGQMLLWLQFHRSVWPRQAAREWRARGAELPCDLSSDQNQLAKGVTTRSSDFVLRI